MARPAITMPSINWCGSISISGRSLHVPGSDSSALKITYFALGVSLGTNDHFIPVGNPGLRRGMSPRIEILNDAVELERRKVFVEIVVDLHGRCARTGADTLHFLQRENAILRRFLVSNLQPLLCTVQNLVPALQHARHVGANLHMMLAPRLAVQHRIVGQRLFDLHVVQVQPPPDLRDHFIADAAVLILRVHQHGNQRAALHRIAGLQFLKLGRECRGEFHAYLSTSPRTISMVPIQAMTSEINWPSISFGSACKLMYEGPRK